MNPFLFGLSPSLNDSALNCSKFAYNQVGDNTGNLAFCYAIDKILGGGLQSAFWHSEPSKLNLLGDIGVLTLANQLGSHANLGYLNDNFDKLDICLVGIGLGAQADNIQSSVEIPKGTLDWVRIIQDKSPTAAPNITVRGEFSLNALEKYGLADKAVALGCPTLFISADKRLGKTIFDRFSPKIDLIAVTAGHQRWTHLARLEASLVNLAQSSSGSYICQSPLEMVQIGRGEATLLDKESRDACRQYAAPWMSNDEFIQWSIRHAYSFFSASAWMEYLRRFDFVIGTRIHGVMLALQIGIPALCLAHDSRTIELCETMVVPYVKAQDFAHGITHKDLSTLFNFDYEKFDNNRKLLAKKYVEFLLANKLPCAQYLFDLSN
jgi:hypothetical protein